MPSLEKNKIVWGEEYDWSKKGEEWSQPWGNSKYMWLGTILPRISDLLPTKHILEIAPGYGRVTQYLIPFCEKLSIVDLNKNCIDFCKKRFNSNSNIHYFQNDGKTLKDIENNSVDFLISWDSLVHAEKDVLESYIKESARVLKEGGVGFIHHSNYGTHAQEDKGFANPHARSASMTAELFEKFCNNVGLKCIVQEIILLGKEDNQGLDVFSLFTKNENINTNTKIINPNFFMEGQAMRNISSLYPKDKLFPEELKSIK
ncbi:class I SAM-dependent methyltransferase [archaeon]|jgi:ubiquinone/menaquinone biosynthesis C-methylase UbiE|nr:class I SAM-dependent methyltransferase [archaeon]